MKFLKVSQITVSLLKDERYVAVWFLPEADTDGINRAESYWVITPVKGKGRKVASVGETSSLQYRSGPRLSSSTRSSGAETGFIGGALHG